ncbi:hypothetical protein [Streptomyces sp. NPDC085596]|uniref:hypothetical protein n=1 Tax=Streptomyces sp. NPDC085596 TaxID=3365731 RepID=UPI0037D7A5A2
MARPSPTGDRSGGPGGTKGTAGAQRAHRVSPVTASVLWQLAQIMKVFPPYG